MNQVYDFENVDTGVVLKPDDLSHALMASYAVLASVVVGDQVDKQNLLYRNFDRLLELNKESTCITEIAAIAKCAQFAIRKANEPSCLRTTKDPSAS
ncbi:hypothetical protein GKA92_24000 [Salmonella enterica subsp. enterica]|nr:hypothetical protein [Salmonella enterica subsp. enterica serovar Abaetetuba]